MFFLYLTVFLCGAAGMIIEFVAVRMVSPFFGSSMEVWSTIIAIIMTAMALGYFMGGVLSQKFKSQMKIIYLIISIAGLFVGLSYLLVEPITTFTSLSLNLVQFSLSLKTLMVVFVLFFLPVFLLGSIYPLVISSLKNRGSGKVSGTIFAISTLGSILGSLLPSFVLIPLVGAKNTFLLTGVILELVAFFGLYKKLKTLPIFILVFLILISPLANTKQHFNQPNIVYQTESIYQKIKIIKTDNIYILSLGDNNYFSSYYSPDNFLSGQYYDYYNLLPYMGNFGKKLDVLIIGLGGGTISRQYDHFFSKEFDLNIDGVEIDHEVIKVGKKYFDMENPSLNIVQMDGRVFLNQTKKKYDLVIVDVYARQSYIPFHLATQEFLQLVKSRLNENGILAFNVSTYSTNDFRFKTISNTVKSVFENSYYYTPYETGNFMILASRTDIKLLKIDRLKTIPYELKNILDRFKSIPPEKIKTIDPNFILKDDTAPEKI